MEGPSLYSLSLLHYHASSCRVASAVQRKRQHLAWCTPIKEFSHRANRVWVVCFLSFFNHDPQTTAKITPHNAQTPTEAARHMYVHPEVDPRQAAFFWLASYSATSSSVISDEAAAAACASARASTFAWMFLAWLKMPPVCSAHT